MKRKLAAIPLWLGLAILCSTPLFSRDASAQSGTLGWSPPSQPAGGSSATEKASPQLLPPLSSDGRRRTDLLTGANGAESSPSVRRISDDVVPALADKPPAAPAVHPDRAPAAPKTVSAGAQLESDLDYGDEPLPPLEEELWLHGGSYLYASEGDQLNWPAEDDVHVQYLRLPEWWQKPRPITHFQEFLGADPIRPWPGLKWCGFDGFQWEPRFVGAGAYELFGIALEDGGDRQDGIGQQMLIDLDLRLTGTERFHMQFRPLGRKNSGGSFWQFSDPDGYIDNSTGVPDRFWFEGEFFSMFGGVLDDPFKPRDYHIVVGKFPFVLQNNLLINDDILGVVVNKNTILIPPFSNLNVQVFAGLDDVDNIVAPSPNLYGVHLTADYRRALLQATYAYLDQPGSSAFDAHYGAASVTQFFGTLSLAGRVLSKWGDNGGRGDGQLYVLESNYTRAFHESFYDCTGIRYGVFYANLFKATKGWNSISGGNFDRLRATFEVDPLISISRGLVLNDTYGAALGVQLFRHNEDESIIPEVAWEEPGGTSVWGFSLRYFRKLNSRTFLEVLGVRTWSDDRIFEREGVFVSTTWIL